MSKQHYQLIKPLKAGAEPFQLLPRYGTPSGVDGIYFIDAYSDKGEEQKQLFLQDAAKLLRSVGQALYAYGFREMEIRTNKAGVAVSGDVMAEFRNPDLARSLYVSIGATACVGLADGRKDCLALVARWREANGKRYDDGPNTWISASLSSFDLAHRFVRIVGLESQPDLLPLPQVKQPKRRADAQPQTIVMSHPGQWTDDLGERLATSLETLREQQSETIVVTPAATGKAVQLVLF